MINRRNFIKSTAVLSLGSLLTSCSSITQNQVQSLEEKIHRKYRSTDDLAKRDNQYLLANLTDSQRKALLDEKDTLLYLTNRLGELKKIDYQKTRKIDFERDFDIKYKGDYQIQFMNPRQIARIYLLLQSLKKDDFRDAIGKEIFEDRRDIQMEGGLLPTERGGLIKISEGQLSLFPVDSTDATREYSSTEAALSNRTYKMPSKAVYDHPNLFSYHLHAADENNEHLAGPSFNVKHPNGSLVGDLNSAKDRIERVGEGHFLVISKLLNDRFDICYYGGEIDNLNKPKIDILSLGTWSYSPKQININTSYA